MPTFSRDEWLEALSAAYPQQSDGVTTKEVAERLGCSVMNAMRVIKRAGWVYAGKKLVPKISGVSYPCECYLPPSKKKLGNSKSNHKA